MSNEAIEEMVEDIMRCYHMGSYDDYVNEELREKYRKMLKEDNE